LICQQTVLQTIHAHNKFPLITPYWELCSFVVKFLRNPIHLGDLNLHIGHRQWFRYLVVLLCLFTVISNSGAQTYVSPKKANSGITVAVEITDNKDLEFIKNNLKRFYGVQRVRVNGSVNVEQAASVLELLEDLQDVQLIKYSGELTEDALLKLEWVNNITLFLKNGKEDQVLLNDNLGKLNGLTLVFEVVPEDYFFIDNLKKIKSLIFIAPFVSKEAAIAVGKASSIAGLKQFGISIDRLTELPKSITSMSGLQSLIVIDNLSWMTEKYYENLPVSNKRIEYAVNGKSKSLQFSYFALETELQPWDNRHLADVFPGMRYAPRVYNNGDSSAISSFTDFIPLRKALPSKLKNGWYDTYIMPEFKDGVFQFEVNSEQNSVLYLGNDAALLVPKLCMKDINDSIFHGNYQLKCSWANREGEYFIRGLPLNFDSSFKHYTLAPQGVLEITATDGRSTLDIRNGYFLKFSMMQKSDTTSRFYAWNSRNSKWENFFDYDYRFDDANLAVVDFYNFYAGKKNGKEMYGVDRSSISDRFENYGYFYLLEPDMQKVALENYGGYWVAPFLDRAPAANALTLKRGKNLIGLKKEYVDRQKEEGIVKFQIYDKSLGLFPELKAFENYIFEVETPMLPRDFSAAFIRGMVYSDFRIVQVGPQFYLDLRTDEGIWRLTLFPASIKYKNQPAKAKSAQNDFLKRYQKYKTIRLQKENAFINYMNQFHTSHVSQTKTKLFFTNNSKTEEHAEFRIRSMGAFTWAAPVLADDSFDIILKFTDNGGIPLDVKRVYIAHAAPYRYQSFGAAENFTCKINPPGLIYIACVDHKDRVFYITAAEFRQKQIRNNSFVYLPVTEMPKGIKNIKELEKILGISK